MMLSPVSWGTSRGRSCAALAGPYVWLPVPGDLTDWEGDVTGGLLALVDRNCRFWRKRYFFLSGGNWCMAWRCGPFSPISSIIFSKSAWSTSASSSSSSPSPLSSGTPIPRPMPVLGFSRTVPVSTRTGSLTLLRWFSRLEGVAGDEDDGEGGVCSQVSKRLERRFLFASGGGERGGNANTSAADGEYDLPPALAVPWSSSSSSSSSFVRFLTVGSPSLSDEEDSDLDLELERRYHSSGTLIRKCRVALECKGAGGKRWDARSSERMSSGRSRPQTRRA